MPIASGVNKILALKKETTWGVLAGAAGGKILGRVTSDLSLDKEKYSSQEIVSHYQQADMQHGVRSVRGNIKGELAPGAQQDLIAAVLRKLFTAVSAITGLSVTVAGAGPSYTLTRGAGDFLTGGIKIGQVVRLTAGSFNAANLNKNLVVVGVTATVLTVLVLNGSALVAEGPIASATVTVRGMASWVPTTGHTDDSFTVEHWHSDIAQSEQFTGCKVSTLAVNLPPTGLAEIDVALFGKDLIAGTAQYFTTPAAASSAAKLASVNGSLVMQSAPVALLTGLQFTLNGNMTAEPVVGSNTYPDIFEGRVLGTGQMSVMFQDATARDYFLNGTEVGLIAAMGNGSAADAEFMSYSMPRIKFSGARKDDGEKAIIQTMPFDILYNSAGGAALANHQTSVQVHDSLAA
jgi:tail tube protein